MNLLNHLSISLGSDRSFSRRVYAGLCVCILALTMSACGGSSGNAGESAGLPAENTSAPVPDSQLPDSEETPVSDNTQPPSGAVTTGGSVVTTSSVQLPQVDSQGQVTWPFAPQPSDVQLEVMPFVEMPLATSGRAGRWNDMEHTGERLFVSNEHDGRIYEITDRIANLWFDVAGAIQSVTGRNLNIDNPWHGGLRGFAFHPDFRSNGKFYVSMMQDRPANPSNFHYLSDAGVEVADSVVVEWTVDPQTFAVDTNSYRELFRVGIPEYDHTIKQIGFNPYAQPGQEDYGLLYIAHGDGSAESSVAQGGERNDALGKILRVNPLLSGASSYSIPSGNPFVGDEAMADEVYSLGHRNPHHLAFLPDGGLLVTEAGHDNIEEVNLVEKGANYGWSRREGAFVHLDSGTLANGISALPADDATNGLTYPVIQFGHTGAAGASFVGQSLGGGFLLDNGSELEGEFFTVDFVRSGRLFHSSLNSILASQTTGDPAQLTMAQSFEASIAFDHDNDAGTDAVPYTAPELLQATGAYDGSGRVDIRIGQGAFGEMYLMNKRNNMIYLVRNSYPPGRAIPAAQETPANIPATTRIEFDITVPVYVSDALQVRLTWGDKDLTASWVVDESWTISDDFPTDTESRLVVSFNDGNGEITLGTFEQNFRTGINATQTFVITADQFDTARWDNDSDGLSNIDELIAGSDPFAIPPTYTAIQQEVFNPRCDGCHDERPSGGLDLRAGVSFANLVNQPSNRQEGAVLVIPFDPDNSYLLQKMEGAPGIRGSSMSAGTALNQMVRDWIAAGALND